MIRPFLALTFNGFREARRNRVTVVVGAFAFGLLVASSLLTNLSISTFDRVLTDVGIGIMSIHPTRYHLAGFHGTLCTIAR